MKQCIFTWFEYNFFMKASERKFYIKLYIVIGLCAAIVISLSFLVLTGGMQTLENAAASKETAVSTTVPTATPETTSEPTTQPTSTPAAETVDVTSDDSLQRIVNKTYTITSSYVPADLRTVNVQSEGTEQLRDEAASMLEQMFAAAEEAGYDLVLISGYRSYTYEQNLYAYYAGLHGEDYANTIDDQPGASEHQLGLAVDLGTSDNACRLQQCFGDMSASDWLEQHAHEYGYILRYPEGKESVTGIIYSPWNYRYVGVEEAEKLYTSGLTMEEYYEVS